MPLDLLDRLPAVGGMGWVLLAGAALIVGFSKSALPGAATIAAALFALVLPAKESTAALLLLLILGDVLALAMYRREVDVRTLVRLIPAVLLGLAAGALFLRAASGPVVQGAIGVILLVLLGVTLAGRRRARRAASAEAASERSGEADPGSADAPAAATGPEAPAAATGPGTGPRIAYGSLGGFTTMVANAGGPVMSMYFYAMSMPAKTFLGTSAWFFAVVNILKLPFSAGLGLFQVQYLLMDLLLAPLVIVAALIGRRIVGRVPQRVFEIAVLALTVVSAVGLIVGALA